MNAAATLLRVAACGFALHAASCFAAAGAAIGLHTQVLADGESVLLGEVATVQTNDLPAMRRLLALRVPVQKAHDGSSFIARDAIAAAIGSGVDVAWSGAPRVRVLSAARTGPLQRVELTARVALEQWLAARTASFHVAADGLSPDLQLPSGRVELSARELPANGRGGSRMVVWVDAAVNGRFVRSIPVSFSVEAYGDAPAADRVEVASVAPVRGSPRAAREPEPAPRIAVAVGQPVTLLVKEGGLQLESRGEALQAGAKGDLVHVRMAGTPAALQGRVLGSHLVEVVR